VTAATERPYTLVAELTYRCPLRCVYCSNPVDQKPRRGDLDTATWRRVFREAEALGVVQLHLTGGEPLLRDDLEDLVAGAREVGLYTNLITSGIPLTLERLRTLRTRGLDAVQISVQGVHESDAVRIAGRASLPEKLEAAAFVREAGLPLTLNVVLHAENIEQVPALVALAERLGAARLELANTQYLGWALPNRAALLPTEDRVNRAAKEARDARDRLQGKMEILFVLPDYYRGVPRACMGGWGKQYIVVTPDGVVLPCHAARSIAGLEFATVDEASLEYAWRESAGMNAFRGEAWMPSPCRECDRRTQDFGGCRCQAFALTGNAGATDPACRLSPDHGLIERARNAARPGERNAVPGEGGNDAPERLIELRYRTFRAAPSPRDDA
jgi:pyrroloquinoline quinone biosynthesis protein E